MTSMDNGVLCSSLQFCFEPNSTKIINVLEKRLPKSCNIYNMCKVYDNYKKPEEMAFYVMCTGTAASTTAIHEGNNDEKSPGESVWVLATYYREDYGMRYAVSAPPNAITTSEIKEVFVKCPYIDWNDAYHFACIDFEISTMIWEISTKVMGNYVTSMPCKIFYVSERQAANVDDTIPEIDSSELVLQPLDRIKGNEFICNTWKYTVPQKTEIAIEKLLTRNKSMGLYDRKTGEIVCGMCVNDVGLMGFLQTLPEYRGKGYATLVAKTLMKTFAEIGAIPCSGVEMRNYKSILFHDKLGMSFSHCADYIKYVPQNW